VQGAAWQGDTPRAARRCARRRAGRFAALARGGDAGIAPRRARAPLPPGAQLEGRTSSPRESSAALARACRPQKAARCRQLCLRRGAHGARRGGRRRPLLRGRLPRCRAAALSLPAAQAQQGASGERLRPSTCRQVARPPASAGPRTAPSGMPSAHMRRSEQQRPRALARRRGGRCLPPPGGEQSCAACPRPLAGVCHRAGRCAPGAFARRVGALAAPCRHALAVLFARRRGSRAADPLLQPGASCHARQNTPSTARITANSTPSCACAQRAPALSPAGGREGRARQGAAHAARALPGASASSHVRWRAAPRVPLPASSGRERCQYCASGLLLPVCI